MLEIKEGSIVRYPVGLTQLNVRRVHKDSNGDFYVRECINSKFEYKRYIFKNMEGYSWDTRLCKEIGFRIADKEEEKYLEG